MKKKYLLTFLFVLFFYINYAQLQKYYLIVSSHPLESIAQNECEKLKATGFTQAGYISSSDAKHYRVYIFTYDSKKLAEIDRDKYIGKFKGAWINGTQTINVDNEIQKIQNELSILKKEFLIVSDSSKQEFYTHKEKIENLENEIKEFKDSYLEYSNKNGDHLKNLEKDIQNVKTDFMNEDIKTNETLDNLELEFRRFKETIESAYVKKSDTIAFAKKIVKFDFGEPKVSLSFGPLLTHLVTSFDPNVLAYFNFDTNTAKNSFYGLYFGGDYHFTQNWSAGLDLQTYVYSNDFYFFPAINIKYSKQLSFFPIKLNPFFAIGTEVFIPNVGSIKGNRFLIYSPGLDIEWGLNKKISLFGNYRYHFNTMIENGKYNLIDGRHCDLSFGIRYNIHKN